MSRDIRPHPHASSATPRRGFALLITITLVAFLVLILVTLASLTRVETQVATNSQQLDKARQNALMALNIAIGQLQKYTGPDQRVTANADLQPVAVGATVETTSGTNLNSGDADAILGNIDTYWRDSRNRRWVGVWRDPDPDRATLNPEAPAATPFTPQLQAWLVSGNEATGTNHLPQTRVENLTLAGVTSPSAATAVFGTTAQPYRLLLGTGTTTIDTSSDLDRAVAAPEVPITSDDVPGLSGPQTVGHYAWWVGDEGVKARANLVDQYAGSIDTHENRIQLQSAQRPAIELMSNMSGLYPANTADLAKVIAGSQLKQVGTSGDYREEVNKRFHDLTTYSRGVLSDTRNGGLKADLSWMLAQTSDNTYRDDLRTVIGDNTLAIDDSILDNRVTPYVSAPGDNTFVGSFALGLSRTATWAQLRSYFNMGNLPGAALPGVIDSTGKAIRRLQTRNTQGIGPIMTHGKLFYGLQIDLDGNISVQIRPLVVLANPYDITLAGDYWVRFDRPGITVRAGAFDATNPVPATPTSASSFPTSYSISSLYTRLNLSIVGAEIPPGEARVYCLDQNYTDLGSGPVQQIRMAEGYDPGKTYTRAIGQSLGTNTHAVIFATKIDPTARLFGADPNGNPSGQPDANLIQYIKAYELKLPGVPASNIFLVYPTAADETRSGGGGWYVLTDSLITPARTSQQANFLQYNPRNLAGHYTGFSSITHPLENAQAYLRNGDAGNDSWFTADLMFDSASGDLVRWGPVTKANSSNPLAGQPPGGVASNTGFTNILYSLPRADQPLASIAQLQHFSPTGFINNGRFDSPNGEQYATQANTFQLNYPVGNSYPNPRVPRERAYFANSSSTGTTNVGTAYDASWLYNEVLADRFYFSSYPGAGNFDFDDPNDNLINSRYVPFRERTLVAADDETKFRGAPRTAATNLLVDGSFNVNSTSVEAWKAVLSSLRGIPVTGASSVQIPFARGLYQPSGNDGSRTANTSAAWAGVHNLSDAEIEDLANELVLQIHRRGPFLSLADFINRQLVASSDDPMNLGLAGALQAAIDAILNQTNDVDAVFRVQSETSNLSEAAFRARTMTAGSPGYILQADLLAPLMPTLSARSDTFVIRTYGDVQNPATGDVTARAWCEAVVQRVPDYVEPSDTPDQIPTASSTNDNFGRRYEIVRFRWLTPEEI